MSNSSYSELQIYPKLFDLFPNSSMKHTYDLFRFDIFLGYLYVLV